MIFKPEDFEVVFKKIFHDGAESVDSLREPETKAADIAKIANEIHERHEKTPGCAHKASFVDREFIVSVEHLKEFRTKCLVCNEPIIASWRSVK